MDKWFDNLVENIRTYLPQVDRDRLFDAYEISEKIYKSLKLKNSDSDFVVRAKFVVDKLVPFKPDEDTVIAAFFYDALDFGYIDLKEIEERFGEDVIGLLDGLRILKSIRLENYQSTDKVDLLRKLFLVMAKDIRVLIIFLSVKVVQMMLCEKLPDDCRQAFSREILEIFVPIASRLGIYRFKTLLEDYSFKYLQHDEYQSIHDQLEKLGKRRGEYMDSVCATLKDFYKERGFYDVRVIGRLKGHYSIYNKMNKKGLTSIDGVYDLFAVRVILPVEYGNNMEESIHKLYEALGLLHGEWKPIASRFKDFIAVPKPNGYRSLHTTVLGLSDGRLMYPVEVQIRSDAMHEEAEYGVASHWLYKDTRGKGMAILKSHVEWLKNLAVLHADIKGDEKALDSVKLDIFGDRIYVLTPKGDVKELPAGATTLDFAYSVHTDVGHRCLLAKVNGKPMHLDTELENGDTVEIVTRKDGIPKLEWLSVVRTSQAKVKIKSWFSSEDKLKNVKRGREQLNIQLNRYGKPVLTPSLSVLKTYGGKKLNLQEREKLLEGIGKGSKSASSVIRRIYDNENLLDGEKKKLLEKKDKKMERLSSSLEDDVLIGGISGMKVSVAKCCAPSDGDEIIGYVSAVKDSATIHKKTCSLIRRMNPERIVSAGFKKDGVSRRGSLYRVKIRIEADGRLGLLGDVGSTVALNGANITAHSSSDCSTEGSCVFMDLDVRNFDHLERIIDSIERINGVSRVIKVS